jgi:hypothetical protein
MDDADGSGMKEKNIRRLREIAGLVPNHGITVDAFAYIYPGEWYILLLETRWYQSHLDITNVAKGQKDADITISQVCNSLHLTKSSRCLYLRISASHLVSFIN